MSNVGWGERERGGTPGRDIFTPRKNFVSPFLFGGGPEWVGGVAGV